MRAGAISWQLAQTFWVGGLWLLHFVMLPTLEKMGLAPLLIEEVNAALSPLLIGFAAFCAVLQGMVLAQAQGLSSLWRELRGQLLLIVLVMAVVFFAVRQWQPDAERWLLFNYLVLALCGLVLVLQPLPGQRSE
ncbi:MULTISPECIES: DUF4149 domain-containing protein [unclassified Pseudomonas]|uniref:DUF4149 domain-containing protein n=1 Tax=unclassified Pseudomonas TaxID=196821 RepID=UPI00244AC143|nr:MULTISPECIES: DUF4149 domain-containing protein [unclassified Pseudomonas]MDG9922073.1 DUF4149 domain-containing protein [Pseudomonas sp. GD04045]MDH0033834.1 DUF4149 domain-containing protein [Pseudomonas sp. GD04019]